MKQYFDGIEVKSTNYKKYAALLNSYLRTVKMYGFRRINNCYNKHSAAKGTVENRILQEMVNRHGYGYAVTTYNCMVFSCAYIFPHPEGGNLILCYETPYNTYYIDAAGL